MKDDILSKRARFIQKNCELNQEFSFAHPKTKIFINNTFNCHLTGSPLWDLSSKEVDSFERTWNVSVRKMLDLPVDTHKYLIEPLSGTPHLRKILIKRFISFIKQVESSNKIAAKDLLNVIRKDTMSVTGNNIRVVLRSVDRWTMEDIQPSDIDRIWYHDIPDEEKWRVSMIIELMEVKMNECEVEGFTDAEILELLNHLCSS